MPPREALSLVERFQNQRFLLCAHAFERAHTAVAACPFEIVDGADADVAVQCRDRLRTDALEVQHVEDAGRELREQLAVKVGVASLADVADPRGEVLADAGNLPQFRFVERGEIVRMIGSDVRAVAVCADLEGVVAFDLQEVRNLAKDSRDAGVIQRANLRIRCGSRGAARRPLRERARSRRELTAGRNRTDTRRRPRRRPSRPSLPPRWRARSDRR